MKQEVSAGRREEGKRSGQSDSGETAEEEKAILTA